MCDKMFNIGTYGLQFICIIKFLIVYFICITIFLIVSVYIFYIKCLFGGALFLLLLCSGALPHV